MIQLGLSARDRRTLVVGVTVVGTLFGLARGTPAVAEWERARIAEAAEGVAHASSARVGVRLLPALRDSLHSRAARLARLDSTLLSGPSAASAAADLASLLDQLATDAGLKVNAMQLRADSAGVGALTQVAVRVTGVTDVTGLAAFLRSVEGDDTPLVVRELAVAQPEPTAPTSKAEALRVDILVEGIARINRENHP